MTAFSIGSFRPRLRAAGAAVLRARALPAFALLLATPLLQAQSIDTFAPHGGRGNAVVITGTGLDAAQSVSFGGTAASFAIDTPTQITATAPAAFTTGAISVDLGAAGVASSQFHYVSRAVLPDIAGMVARTALPLGATVDVAPLDDNAFGQPGGVTYTFSSMPLPASTWVYFGADQGRIGISMDNNQPSGAELMTFSAPDSNLPAGRIVYVGDTVLPLATGPSENICTRLTLQVLTPGVPVLLADDVGGLPAGIGAVIAFPPDTTVAVNLLIEGAYQPCTSWQPALQLYDQAQTHPGALAYSTYTTGFFYENTPPVLSPIDDQLVADGGSTPALPFTLDDAETGADAVLLTALSSDLGYVPQENIDITGSDNEYAVTVATVAGQPGPSTITLVADDAAAVTEEVFSVGQLTLPTISDVADVLVQVTVATDPIPFTIADPQSAPADLVVTASSSNQTLVPDGNLVLGGTDGARTLVAQPAGSQTGQATITLTVTDPDSNSSSDTFVLTVNARPTLTANNPAVVSRGQAVVYTESNLHAVDAESADSALRYTLAPGNVGTAGHNGSVRLDGVVLTAGESFTQQDVADARLSFLHDGSCNAPGQFTFDVDDGMGGFARAPASPFGASVQVTFPNDAPSAQALALAVPLGGSTDGQLQGTDTDCLEDDVLAYALADGALPAKGVVSNLNSVTGAFTYTASDGQSGADSFDFEVSDGTSTTVATVSVTIANSTPAAQDGALLTSERTPAAGTLEASDADLPAQPLTFAISSPPTKGTVSALDPASGAYTYTPAANRIGSDAFAFTASDGSLTSAPATVEVMIRPSVDHGDLAVSDAGASNAAQVVLVDPFSGDQFQLATGDLLGEDEPHGIAFDANGDVIVVDAGGVLLRIVSATGQQVALAAGLGDLVLGLAVDQDGSILVALGPDGVVRLDGDSGQVLQTYTDDELQLATDVDVMEDGRLVVTDAGGFPPVPAQANVLYFDPVSGAATVLPVAGLEFPISIARTANGNLLVGDGVPAFGSSSSAIDVIDGASGVVIDSITGSGLDGITGIDINVSGHAYAASTGNQTVLALDVPGAAAAPVSSVGLLARPWGMAVFSGPEPIFKDGFEDLPAVE